MVDRHTVGHRVSGGTRRRTGGGPAPRSSYAPVVGELVLAVLLVAAVVAAVAWVPRLRAPVRHRTGGVLRHPGTWLGVVVALFLANQVLVTAFVEQTWHGDPDPVARYLPSGWFALADLGPLATALPAWPWTVLHVQAGLELPFVLLAYLLVCRWSGEEVFARVLAARWLLSGVSTVTFCLIELDLANPWTPVDLVVRVASGIVTPLLLAQLAPGGTRPTGLVTLALSAGALGVLVLAVYDTATLYDLGHLAGWVPGAAAGGAVLAVARWVAARRSRDPAPLAASAIRSIGWFLVLFAVPSLPLRYAVTFGLRPLALAAGAVLVLTALRRGWDHRRRRALVGIAAVALVAAAAGSLATAGYPEARLLVGAVAFVLAGAALCTVLDRPRTPRPGRDGTRGRDGARGQGT